MTKPCNVDWQRQSLSWMRVSILYDLNSLLAAIERKAGVIGLHVEISGKGCSTQLNDLFLNSCVRVVLEGKGHRPKNVVFPIIWAYIDCATGFRNDANRTGAHRMYYDLMFKVLSQNCGWGWSAAKLETLRKDVSAIKYKIENIFRLYTHSVYLR